MGVTIVDIAREAGVSRTTVSNILNGVYKCRPETKETVLRLAKEMGYRPNIAAKTLVNNTSKLIGVIFPSYVDQRLLTGNPFYNIIIDGINSTLSERGDYDLIINCISKKQDSEKLIDWIRMRNIDGIIIVGEINNKVLEDIAKEDVPLVLIDNYSFDSNKVLFVNTEDQKGSFIGTEHLIKKGYKNIAFCSSDVKNSNINNRRYKGYQEVMSLHKLEEKLFLTNGIFFEDGIKIAKELLEKKADSVVCTSDMLALGIVKGVIRAGKKVPEDIAVVGFDNLEISSQFVPELTTISQNIFGKGKVSVELLLESIVAKSEINKVILPVELVVRETT